MNHSFLLIGGNIGNREENLTIAQEWIKEICGKIIAKSSVYETQAWGNTLQAAFLNQVIQIETHLDPEQLITHLLEIEKKMGRVRMEKMGPRIIDLDILLFNHAVINQPHLSIPHPELQNRRFALVPLNEIAPDEKHPILGKTIQELLALCIDHSAVQKK